MTHADGYRYWLPNLLKHNHIALRFLPQQAYEKAAPLTVTPSPDVVTRVFMLFSGVDEEGLGAWDETASRATEEDDVSFWTDVVGVDVERAMDGRLFQVLVWGGMEVLRSKLSFDAFEFGLANFCWYGVRYLIEGCISNNTCTYRHSLRRLEYYTKQPPVR